MSGIFLSYSHHDNQIMIEVKQTLIDAGLSVWTDESIKRSSPDWAKEIKQQIEICCAFVIILSPHANKSQYVRQEIDHAQAFGKSIFSLLAVGDETTSIPSQLDGYNWTDLRHSNTDLEIAIKEIKVKCVQPADLTVADCMDDNPRKILASADLASARLYMDSAPRRTCLVVVERNHVDAPIVGLLTESMLTDRLPPRVPASENMDIAIADLTDKRFRLPVKEAMISYEGRMLDWLLPETPVVEALDEFIRPRGTEKSFRIRQFPVLAPRPGHNDYKAVGVLGYWMIVNRLVECSCVPDVSVDAYMLRTDTRGFVPVTPHMTLTQVRIRAQSHAWSHIAITDDNGNLLGMTTIEKILRLTDDQITYYNDRSVTTDMRPFDRCTKITEGEPLSRYISRFTKDEIGALPVLEKGTRRLKGLLTYDRVLTALLDHLTTAKP